MPVRATYGTASKKEAVVAGDATVQPGEDGQEALDSVAVGLGDRVACSMMGPTRRHQTAGGYPSQLSLRN
jgi:hypothetical protein